MIFLYNLVIWIFVALLWVVHFFNGKLSKMVKGRKEQSFVQYDGREVICVHCASLGEFEQGRVLIEKLRAQNPNARLVLTFFSSSGYEIRKNFNGVDEVYYLPFDTKSAVRKFVKTLNPLKFYIIKYEYWYNLLRELKANDTKIYLVSAIFSENSIFFKKKLGVGALYRSMLGMFSGIFVQDAKSKELLEGIGFSDNVVVAGDTRFDRVAGIADEKFSSSLVDEFMSAGGRCVVCGSTWAPDEEFLCEVMKARGDWLFIVAPHEISESGVERLIAQSGRKASRYSKGVINEGSTLLVIDCIGLLSKLYSFGEVSYIGGGFGVGIHNTLEAAAWGTPVVFGTNYHKFREACQLIECGAARSISSAEELLAAFDYYMGEGLGYGEVAANYVASNIGASDTILNSSL